MHPQRYDPQPHRITPIIRPDRPSWVVPFADADWHTFSRPTLAATAPVLIPVGFLALMAFPGGLVIGGLGAAVSTLVFLVVAALGIAEARRHVVSGPDYTYEGVAIEGGALDLLADIQHRFAWAEKMFGDVPTGIRWQEVEGQVEILLWDAAGHAAKVSALDTEIRNLAYANPGTAQAALRDDLQDRRRAYWTMLEETQREADDLAREASNTAAAARLALQTGTLRQLELLTPSGANLVARGTLAAARARLALLAEVWGELTE